MSRNMAADGMAKKACGRWFQGVEEVAAQTRVPVRRILENGKNCTKLAIHVQTNDLWISN